MAGKNPDALAIMLGQQSQQLSCQQTKVSASNRLNGWFPRLKPWAKFHNLFEGKNDPKHKKVRVLDPASFTITYSSSDRFFQRRHPVVCSN
jgi:hypothetical protein